MNRAAQSLLLNLLWICILAMKAHAGQFGHVVYYTAGQRPVSVVTAHFTHSRNLDLAFADWLSDQLCILLGNGDGTFKKASCTSASLPIGIATGDFDEDGNQDLALFESGGTGHTELVVLLGDGKGGFRQYGRYQTGIVAGGLAVADFNGDGHLDVALTNEGFNGPGDIMVFFGNGHGKFGKPTKYGVNKPGWVAIAAGDLNGDGKPDLAVTNLDGYVHVLLNDGTERFKKPVSYNAGGGEVVDVKIADLRNDGRNDLVIANASWGMVVLLNNGNGTFGKPTIYQPHFFNWQPPNACTVADFNLDGILDIACAAQAEDSYFFYGKGDGTFGLAVRIHDTIQNQGGYSIASGNFKNGDKGPDLAIPIEIDGEVAIMLNTQ